MLSSERGPRLEPGMVPSYASLDPGVSHMLLASGKNLGSIHREAIGDAYLPFTEDLIPRVNQIEA